MMKRSVPRNSIGSAPRSARRNPHLEIEQVARVVLALDRDQRRETRAVIALEERLAACRRKIPVREVDERELGMRPHRLAERGDPVDATLPDVGLLFVRPPRLVLEQERFLPECETARVVRIPDGAAEAVKAQVTASGALGAGAENEALDLLHRVVSELVPRIARRDLVRERNSVARGAEIAARFIRELGELAQRVRRRTGLVFGMLKGLPAVRDRVDAAERNVVFCGVGVGQQTREDVLELRLVSEKVSGDDDRLIEAGAARERRRAAKGSESRIGIAGEMLAPVVDDGGRQGAIRPTDGEARDRAVKAAEVEAELGDHSEVASASAGDGPEQTAVRTIFGDVEDLPVGFDDAKARQAVAGEAERGRVEPPTAALNESADADVAATAAGQQPALRPERLVDVAEPRARSNDQQIAVDVDGVELRHVDDQHPFAGAHPLVLMSAGANADVARPPITQRLPHVVVALAIADRARTEVEARIGNPPAGVVVPIARLDTVHRNLRCGMQ